MRLSARGRRLVVLWFRGMRCCHKGVSRPRVLIMMSRISKTGFIGADEKPGTRGGLREVVSW